MPPTKGETVQMPDSGFRTLGVLERLQDFHLPQVPYAQIMIARTILPLDYARPPGTSYSIDGLDYLDNDRPYLLAMNHTDRFNYAPFMKELDRIGFSPLAPWVKGKYYQKAWLAKLLTWCACMPVPSRGFLLTLDWLARVGRRPREDEYRELRSLGDGLWSGEELSDDVRSYLEDLRHEDPAQFAQSFQRHFEGLTAEVVRINQEALEFGYRPLVFPQGTRSRRLTPGFSGVVQMALHLGVSIVPIGVSGSDLLYPGDSIFSKGGHCHYTIGEPIDLCSDPRAPRDFLPLTIDASRRYEQEFQRLTDLLMDRINDLLPEEYQFGDRAESLQAGTERFL